MPVVSGSSARGLAEDLAVQLDWQHVQMESRRFPDGEGYVRVPEDAISFLRDQDVVVVSNTFPDSGIVETLLMLEAISDVRAGRLASLKGGMDSQDDVGAGLFLAIPYFGYSRQDKRFQKGEAISAQALGRIFAGHCDGIVVLDLHAPVALEGLEVPVRFVSAMPEVAEYLSENVNPDFILSPDKGAIERASSVAQAIGCRFSYLEKVRIDAHTIVHQPKDLDVDGSIVAIIDDMISTGGTICKASEALHSQGATEVHAACTHGLFTDGAISRLDQHVDGVHATNSLSNPRSSISGGKALARGVRELLDI